MVILGADATSGAQLGREFAELGYEVRLGDAGDLAPPVFLLALPDAAREAWSMTGFAAASIVGDARIARALASRPGMPVILHLDDTAHGALGPGIETAHPDLPVHRLPATADGERLLRLRSLRLFAAAAGRGEV